MTTPHRPTPGPRRRWLLPAFLLLALAGALAAVIFQLGGEPEPVVVAIAVTQYDAPEWPSNPYAEQDARGFADRFAKPFLAFERQGKAGILTTLRDAVTEANKGERPLVIYLSALGTVAGDTAFLLPSDARVEAESGWLKLDDILTPLRAAAMPTLLILDVRPARVPLRLFPTGDVNEKLDAELAALATAENLPFTVLTSNTSKGGAAVLYPLQRSLFGLACSHAVGGAADGWTPAGGKDDLVRVEEFTAHVIAATADGSKLLGEAQVPRVHRPSAGKDFTLTKLPKDGVAALPEPAAPRVYPPLLTEAWTAADEARAAGFDLRVPGRMRPFVANALRAEERWLAGIGEKAVGQTLEPKSAAFKAEVAARGPVNSPVVSVVRLAKGASFADHGRAAEPLLRKALDAIRTPTPMLKEEVDKELAKIAADATTPADAIAAAVFDAAKKLVDPTQEQLRQLLRLATASPQRKPFAELATLEVLAGLPPGRFVQRFKPEASVFQVLDAAEQAERAAVFDSRSLPWLGADIRAADGIRRNALVALCDPDAAAPDIRTAPVKMEKSAQMYTATIANAERLHRARGVFEAARAVRDDLATDGPAHPSPRPGEWERNVRELADAYGELETRLRPPATGTAVVADDLGRVADALKDRVTALTTARTRESVAPTVRELERLLRWPGWSATKRQALRADLFKRSDADTARVLAGWPTDFKPAPASGPTPSAAVPGESIRDLRIALARHGPNDRVTVDLATAFDATRATLTGRAAFTAMARSVAGLKTIAPAPPDAERDSHLAAQQKYAAWLAERYEAAATAVEGVTFEAGFSPAKRWREVAESCR